MNKASRLFNTISSLRKKLRSDYELSRVLKGGGVVLLIQIAGAGLSFIATAVVARLLGVEQYGIFAFYLSLSAVLVLFGGLGVPGAAVKFVAEYRELHDYAALKGFLRAGYWLTLATSAAIAVAAGLTTAALGVEFADAPPMLYWTAFAAIPINGYRSQSDRRAAYLFDTAGRRFSEKQADAARRCAAIRAVELARRCSSDAGVAWFWICADGNRRSHDRLVPACKRCCALSGRRQNELFSSHDRLCAECDPCASDRCAVQIWKNGGCTGPANGLSADHVRSVRRLRRAAHGGRQARSFVIRKRVRERQSRSRDSSDLNSPHDFDRTAFYYPEHDRPPKACSHDHGGRGCAKCCAPCNLYPAFWPFRRCACRIVGERDHACHSFDCCQKEHWIESFNYFVAQYQRIVSDSCLAASRNFARRSVITWR